MKNKVLIRSLVVSLFAFMLYSANMHKLQDGKVKVIEPKSSKVVKNNEKEPNIKTSSVAKTSSNYAKNVTVEKGSQKSLAKNIEKAMGSGEYQVSVQDLNNSAKFAHLSTTSKSHSANGAMRLLVLASIYAKEQSGKMKSRSNIRIKKSDRAKGEKMLQTNMLYGIAYLRQLMMHNNQTAGNALLRKAGKGYCNQVAAKFGAKQTAITGTFTNRPVGHTTANDLDSIFKGIYQGKVLKRQYAQLVLTALSGSRTKLTSGISGTIYSVGDSHFATAIVQTGGKSYVISVWAKSVGNFKKLGTTVNKWFASNN